MNIQINVTGKRATVEGSPVIVCGNNDYILDFAFDDAWTIASDKVARFVYVRNGVREHMDTPINGTFAAVPFLTNTRAVQIGVYSGDGLSTTTPARIPCELSIRCEAGAEAATMDAYKSGYDAAVGAFWEDLQNGGARTDYSYAFKDWADVAFVPKYSIKPVGTMDRIFYHYRGAAGLIDMINRGLEFDTSGATSATLAFACDMVRIPTISTVGMTTVGNLFAYAQKCHTIDSLVLKEDGSQGFNSALFAQCYALENLVIKGTIGQNGFSVNQSNKLTVDSLMSIINALKEYSDNTHTVTLGKTNLDKLTNEQKAIATEKGWTLA